MKGAKTWCTLSTPLPSILCMAHLPPEVDIVLVLLRLSNLALIRQMPKCLAAVPKWVQCMQVAMVW